MTLIESGKELIEAIYKFRCELYSSTHVEYERALKLMIAHGRSLSERTEDEELRTFIEKDSHFKPSPETLQARHIEKVMSDPEMAKRMHDLTHQMEDMHDA